MLTFNEAGFRSLKAIDLGLRRLYHYTEARVRAHVVICMLAPPERTDSVAPAKRSAGALAKVYRHADEAGETLHRLSTLLDKLATLTHNLIVFTSGARITKLVVPTPLQRRAFELIGVPVPIELKPM